MPRTAMTDEAKKEVKRLRAKKAKLKNERLELAKRQHTIHTFYCGEFGDHNTSCALLNEYIQDYDDACLIIDGQILLIKRDGV